MQITPSCLVNMSKKNYVQKRTQQGCRVTERPVSQMADLIVFFGIHANYTFWSRQHVWKKLNSDQKRSQQGLYVRT